MVSGRIRYINQSVSLSLTCDMLDFFFLLGGRCGCCCCPFSLWMWETMSGTLEVVATVEEDEMVFVADEDEP